MSLVVCAFMSVMLIFLSRKYNLKFKSENIDLYKFLWASALNLGVDTENVRPS